LQHIIAGRFFISSFVSPFWVWGKVPVQQMRAAASSSRQNNEAKAMEEGKLQSKIKRGKEATTKN
jgi:hypothetical protein